MSSFNYTVLPASRNEALNDVGDDGHIHCLYEPLKGEQSQLQGPFKCSKCEGCYGGSRIVESQGVRHWICIFCNTYNKCSSEKMADTETYVGQTSKATKQPILAIVVDTVCDTAELQALQQTLKLAPESKYALVTLQHHGDVAVHSPEGSSVFSSKHHKVESNLKKFNEDYFTKHLGRTLLDAGGVMGTLRQLKAKDTSGSKRAKRATGLALFLASMLGDQVLCFLAGPCTEGPGKVISKEKRHYMRQQKDIDQSARYAKDARAFYSKMVSRASFDIFVSSLDQIGLVEMSDLLSSVAQFDSFTDERFAHSLQSYLKIRETGISDVRLTAVTSGRLLVDGVLRPASALRPVMNNYSDTPRGNGHTNKWKFESSCVDPSNFVVPMSLSVLTGPTIRAAGETVPEQLYIQFQLTYTRHNANYTHVHTKILPTSNSPDCSVLDSFNPKIEIAYLMKVSAFQTMKGNFTSSHLQRVRYSLDNMAIKNYQNQEFLKFLYALRRTPLFTSRNCSPDERAIFLHRVIHSSSDLCLLYALPSVVQFQMGKTYSPLFSQDLLADPSPALIDGGYFVGVRYAQECPEVDAARKKATQIVKARFPEPLFIDTIIGGSPDRFFKSKFIPMDEKGAQILETQDLPLQNFVRLVRKRANGI